MLLKNIKKIHRLFSDAILFDIFSFPILVNDKLYKESSNDYIIKSNPSQILNCTKTEVFH